jgi:MFS transporter, DHA1 family, multidrug resistance protein
MFVTFMPLAMKRQGMTTTHVGFVFAIQTLTNALSRYPSGWLCDRVADRGRLVAFGLAVFFLALGAFGPCASVGPLMAVAALMGGSMGVAYTVICALIADVVSREVRGLAMGCYNTCVYFGMMLSSAGMGPIIRAEGFRAGFFIVGAMGVVVLLLFKAVYRHHPATC